MVTKCSNGHWYDPNVHKSCPHCKRAGEQLSIFVDNVEEDDKTVSIADVDVSLGEELGAILGGGLQQNTPADMVMSTPTNISADDYDEDNDKTISFGFFGVTAITPVTGWLICLTGDEKGKDYRLHAGKNYIGRGTSMDVALIDDKTISRDKHCSLSYDPKGNRFYLSPEGGNIVSLNDEILEEATEIKDGDIVGLGDTKLAFVPYCKEERKWEEE